MYCRTCSAQNAVSARFCERCGSATLAPYAAAYGAPPVPSPVAPLAAKKNDVVRNVVIGVAIFVVLLIGVASVAVVNIVRLASKAVATAIASEAPSPVVDDTSGEKAPDGTPLPATIANVADAPFTIRSCEVVETSSTDPSGNVHPHLWMKAVLVNVSDKTLTATRVQMHGLDAFGSQIDPAADTFAVFNDDDAVVIPAGDRYTSVGTYDKPDVNIRKLTCTQAKAQFRGGDSWVAPK